MCTHMWGRIRRLLCTVLTVLEPGPVRDQGRVLCVLPSLPPHFLDTGSLTEPGTHFFLQLAGPNDHVAPHSTGLSRTIASLCISTEI